MRGRRKGFRLVVSTAERSGPGAWAAPTGATPRPGSQIPIITTRLAPACSVCGHVGPTVRPDATGTPMCGTCWLINDGGAA